MSPGSTYGPADYDAMFADRVRTPAYLGAIARTVRPGDIVVEVGTGVGYFAVAACRAGAQRVYAIEREPAIVLAEAVARENGFADRIVCIRGDARRLELPERGTVLITDLRGTLPLFGDAIPTLIAVRERLLVPGARLIPRRDVIRAAPCTAPPRWKSVEDALGDVAHGIHRGSVAAFARSQVHGESIAADTLCAQPCELARLDYTTIATPDVEARLAWRIERNAPVAGIAIWFEADLSDGVGFSTTPGQPETVYGHSFLPLARALDASAGDTLDCRVRARLVDGTYVFAWDTEWRAAAPGAEPTRMRQSSLGSVLATVGDREIRRDSYRPHPETFGLIPELLALADGNRTLAHISEALLRAHPEHFESAREALAWVTRTHARLAELSEG